MREPEAQEELNAPLRANAGQIKDRVRLFMVVGDKDMTFASHAPFVTQLDELRLAHTYKVLPDIDHNLGKYHELTGAGMVEFLTRDFPKTAVTAR